VSGPPTPIGVGVFPAAELRRRQALFAALEGAFPVRFEGREDGSSLSGLGAVIELGGEEQAAAASGGLPALALLVPEGDTTAATAIQTLVDTPELDQRLRGASLPDTRLAAALQPGASIGEIGGAIVLARCGKEPTWTRAGGLEKALLAPAELKPGEALRERLCDGRSAALLPLVSFLRRLTAAIRWQPPLARASLLFDDPNLHWSSYGYLKLPELARHAREHRYHVALATVPLDGWLTSRGAARALEQSGGAISLLVHGNDHNGGELGRQATEADGLRLAAQAQRRIGAFEHRTGIAVDRVMVPPHEECSEGAVGGLLRCGFEAITMTRPFPWLAQPPRSWLSRPVEAGPLVGWRLADFAGRLPVLLRHPIVTRDAPELVLRAFLDQPLILYGHHEDVAAGLDVLAAAVDDVNRLGETRWCSLGEIATGNFESRRADRELGIRPYSRRVRVQIPDGVDRLRVELPDAHPGPESELIALDGRPLEVGEPLNVTPGTSVELYLSAVDGVDVQAVPPPPRNPLALARRALGEGRDRLRPLVSRAR